MDFDFEVRTTVHSDLLTTKDINKIINDLYQRGYKRTYYLQNFIYDENIIANLKQQSYKISPLKFDKRIDVKIRD